MRRRTRLFLLAGCAVIVFLEAPATLAGLAASWRGPYSGRGLETRTADLVTTGARKLVAAAHQPQSLALARR